MLKPLLLLVALFTAAPACAAPSQCFGTVANGRIDDSVKLPLPR